MYPATTMSQPDRQLERFGNYWGESLIVNETAIMDDNGNLLPRGEAGELVHRGPNVMMGYYKDAAATLEAGRFGWHHTYRAGGRRTQIAVNGSLRQFRLRDLCPCRADQQKHNKDHQRPIRSEVTSETPNGFTQVLRLTYFTAKQQCRVTTHHSHVILPPAY